MRSWIIYSRHDMLKTGPVEARGLAQALFQAQTAEEAARLPLWIGNNAISLGDICRIESKTDGQLCLRLEGDFSRWNALGFGLAQGRIEVRGDVGARTGGELAGGSIEIHGDCGPWAGVAAKSGRMLIHGHAGDWLGAHWPGETRGLTGAEIFVNGNAGDHAGARMRRGLIAIAGNAGVGLGRAMVAGSIFAGSQVAGPVGSGMKRGSIVLSALDDHVQSWLLPSFEHAGAFRPLTLDLQLKYLASLGWAKAGEFLDLKTSNRYFGDRLAMGLGEVLLLQ